MNDHIYSVLQSPHITEKVASLQEQNEGQVVIFKVKPGVSKHQIREAVETIFKVKVAKVRTCNFQGKLKRQGRNVGRRASWKKAYVTLRPGEKDLEFFEGA